MFVLLPLSGVFYPTSALPTILQPIALALPTTHAFNALRTIVDTHTSDWGQVAIAAFGSLVLLGLSMWFLTSMLKTFRRRGYVTRYTLSLACARERSRDSLPIRRARSWPRRRLDEPSRWHRPSDSRECGRPRAP